MKQIIFECKLLSDVVLKSSSATQGVTENLDYIPGAKFLGIAAKSLYDMQQVDKTKDVFHNGNVQFGDAHICIEGQRTKKVPLSWFYKKGEGINDLVYLNHKLTKDINYRLSIEGVQLKQARQGYFVKDKYVNTETNFSIKSAYDSNKRKAEDSQMYGYYALPKGSVWEFTVIADEKYILDITASLEGKKRIGRSRSAEYGLVEIKAIKTIELESNEKVEAGEVIVYAESNLCFFDHYGQNTLQPTASQLGFPDGSEIVWEKSQIRARKYQTWNSKRYNRDADRMIIEKGSVFIVRISGAINTNDFIIGVGSCKNEGFGRIIINPDFLISENEKLKLKLFKYENSTENIKYLMQKGEKDTLLIDFLKNSKNEKKRVVEIDKLVNDFINKYRSTYAGVSASQWGQVRNYAKHASNEKILLKLLFDKDIGYFMHGQSEHKWRINNRRGLIEEYVFSNSAKVPEGSKLEFIQKLASEMSKNVKSKKQENA